MDKQLILIFKLLLGILITIITFLLLLIFIIVGNVKLEDIIPKSDMEIALKTDFFNRNNDVSLLDTSKKEQMIKYGHELIVNTSNHLGPSSKMAYAGNNLACQNCHLGAGTKAFAAPYIGLTQKFPQLNKRTGKTIFLSNRINGCMERSMNGKKLPIESKEMKAMISYMEWLSRDMPKEFVEKNFVGSGFLEIEMPNRSVNLIKGKMIYEQQCISCHQENGKGQQNKKGNGYNFPPLWGNDSYNHGAGMYRVLTAAQFIKANMPFGASAENPILTDEEAYDVAGYINNMERPIKQGVEKDYPILKLKPVSSPYPPYADTFSIKQHKFGPFQPIIKFYKENYHIKKTK